MREHLHTVGPMLVAYYGSNDFTPAGAFTVGEDRWPRQAPARRVG